MNERLRRRAALQESVDPGEPPVRDTEHDRGGLQAEFALILGIELSDGELL